MSLSNKKQEEVTMKLNYDALNKAFGTHRILLKEYLFFTVVSLIPCVKQLWLSIKIFIIFPQP